MGRKGFGSPERLQGQNRVPGPPARRIPWRAIGRDPRTLGF
jgi:hypothetical protein